MKAIVCTRYGPPEVLQLREVDKPVPGDDEVLIKVYATTVTSGDCHIRKAEPFITRFVYGLTKPKVTILGFELAGEIEAVGKDVTLFKAGDRVFAGTGFGLGACAEYICLPESGAVAVMPDSMTYDEAAAIPFGASTSLYFLRDKGNIRGGQKVLIYGASGSVGTAAVQVARIFGAEVTGVCSTANIELVKSLGADKVIDYIKEDFTASGETYDIIFDTVGKTSFSRCKRSLKQNGLFLSTVAGPSQLAHMIWTSLFGSKKMITGVASDRKEDMVFLIEFLETGKLKPVIDRRYPLEQTAEAHRYVDNGHKIGNVVITIGHD